MLLAKLIDSLIPENEEPQTERADTFVNRELVRRELARKRGRARSLIQWHGCNACGHAHFPILPYGISVTDVPVQNSEQS